MNYVHNLPECDVIVSDGGKGPIETVFERNLIEENLKMLNLIFI